MRKVFRKKDKCGLSSHSHQAMDQGWGLQTTSPCASVNSLWDLTIWTGPWCMSILFAQIITQSTSLAVPIPPPICPALRGEGRGVCPTPGKPTVYPFGRIRGKRTHWISWSKLEAEEDLGPSWRTFNLTSHGHKGLGKDLLPGTGHGGQAGSRP